MASITAENSGLSPGLTLVDSLRQGSDQTHIFWAFFSNLSHDVLPGTHPVLSRIDLALRPRIVRMIISDDWLSPGGASVAVSTRRSPGLERRARAGAPLRGFMRAGISQRFFARASAGKAGGACCGSKIGRSGSNKKNARDESAPTTKPRRRQCSSG